YILGTGARIAGRHHDDRDLDFRVKFARQRQEHHETGEGEGQRDEDDGADIPEVARDASLMEGLVKTGARLVFHSREGFYLADVDGFTLDEIAIQEDARVSGKAFGHSGVVAVDRSDFDRLRMRPAVFLTEDP